MEKKIAIEFMKDIKYPTKNIMLQLLEQQSEDVMLNSKDKYYEESNCFQIIRNAFHQLNLDDKNYHTNKWNPLGEDLIKEGNTILIKPNMVLEKNKNDEGEDCLYTNPSIVAAIIPYVWKALKGKGKIIVADAPVQSCDFEKLIEESGYKQLIEYYKKQGINIELKDLRGLISKYENGIMKQNVLAKEENSILVDLGNDSEHARLNEKDLNKVRITNYNPDELLKHHNEQKHEYLIAKEALEADVIINMPKPKAHRKAGVTIGLKNFVGINTRKEYLPHHRKGDTTCGGDEYLKKAVLLRINSRLIDFSNRLKSKKKYKMAKRVSVFAKICSGLDKRLVSKEKNREGSWYGNDTIWRTIIDINKIIKYADKSGKMQEKPQRKIFSIADMIIIGEKEGPLLPSPKFIGAVAMGEDIVCFDEIIATILGLDINKIPLFKHLREERKYPLVEENKYGVIASNNINFNNKTVNKISKKEAINIEPSSGWKNHIELEK